MNCVICIPKGHSHTKLNHWPTELGVCKPNLIFANWTSLFTIRTQPFAQFTSRSQLGRSCDFMLSIQGLTPCYTPVNNEWMNEWKQTKDKSGQTQSQLMTEKWNVGLLGHCRFQVLLSCTGIRACLLGGSGLLIRSKCVSQKAPELPLDLTLVIRVEWLFIIHTMMCGICIHSRDLF